MPEFAFIGRSNVGKSSLINLITSNRQLAKTSASPGKTQLINHFLIKSEVSSAKSVQWYLVDLPGYGYAQVSQGTRKQWKKMIEQYIRQRTNLKLLFVLIDIRHRPQALDLEFINQLGAWSIPLLLVFTKSDQITQREAAASVKSFMESLEKHWDEMPGYVVTSSAKGRGRKELLGIIEEQLMLSNTNV